MKTIIAGGRKFNDYDLMCRSLENHTEWEITEVVWGAAPGADTLGKKWADEHGISHKPFPADWTRYGRPAGPIRNEAMAKYAEAAIVFWDGKSSGSADMIQKAKQHNLKLKVINY